MAAASAETTTSWYSIEEFKGAERSVPWAFYGGRAGELQAKIPSLEAASTYVENNPGVPVLEYSSSSLQVGITADHGKIELKSEAGSVPTLWGRIACKSLFSASMGPGGLSRLHRAELGASETVEDGYLEFIAGDGNISTDDLAFDSKEARDTLHGRSALVIGDTAVSQFLGTLANEELSPPDHPHNYQDSLTLLSIAALRRQGYDFTDREVPHVREAGIAVASWLIVRGVSILYDRQGIAARLDAFDFKPTDSKSITVHAIGTDVLGKGGEAETIDRYVRGRGGNLDDYYRTQAENFLTNIMGVHE
jgi:hypothetical protein